MPTDEFYRVSRPTVFLGITLEDLRTVLGENTFTGLLPYLQQHLIPEPEHVNRGDVISTILPLDVRAYETSGGENELPRATLRMAHGRDAGALARGVTDRYAVAPIHLIEGYINTHIRAKLYQYTTTTASSGVFDRGDNDGYPAEWIVVFDGYCIAPNRRGTPEDHALIIHMTHILAGLSYSSSISGAVAAGTGYSAAFNLTAFGASSAGAFSNIPLTPFGMVAEGLNGSTSLMTDFWGYRRAENQVGVKGFLTRLANTDAFAKDTFVASLDGAICDTPLTGKNDLALTALAAIEPFGHAFNATAQDAVAAAISAASSSSVVLDRASLIDRVGTNYQDVGYRYGIPIPFKLEGAVLANGTADNFAKSFAGDIVGATFNELGPASHWELMSVRYPSRYQIVMLPNATGGLVAPAAPIVDGWWQTIHASEIHDWGDDLPNPAPVRGVVLVSNRSGIANALTGGAPTQSNPGTTLSDGGYDSCQPGVILYKDMPPWLVTANRLPGTAAPATITGPRTVAAVAAVTGAAAATAAPIAPAVPVESRKTANRLAKALYQLARLLPRTVSISCRFRTDIAPGSIVRVEMPDDKFVRRALGGIRETHLVGTVVRVVLAVDVDSETAVTHLQLGFVRTSGEAAAPTTNLSPPNPLYGVSHPFWNAVFYGHPWCDSIAARTQLGNLAKIGD